MPRASRAGVAAGALLGVLLLTSIDVADRPVAVAVAAPAPVPSSTVAASAPIAASFDGDAGQLGGEADARVTGFGTARPFGAPNATSGRPLAIAATPSGDGYWLAAADGGVFTYGDARFVGSAGHLALRRPIVGIAATPTGRGYRLSAADGAVFAFGDAGYLGGANDLVLRQPIVAIATTPSGRGYWLAAADGAVLTYGDAPFHGSAGALPLQRPIVGIAATPTGRGYWLVAADGGIFAFGDAPYLGGTGAQQLNEPIVGIAATPTGRGYWLAAADGGIFTYGDAPYRGSDQGRLPPTHGVVGVAAHPGGEGYWEASSPSTVSIAVAGDVHGEAGVRLLLASGGNPFAPMASVLGGADVAAINLETPVGTLGEPVTTTYVFQAPDSLLHAAREAGVDVVNLANNHALDHGVAGLRETIATARAVGLEVVGAGENAAEAYAPAILGPPGRRIAVVGLTRVLSGGWAATADRPGVASALDEGAAVAAVHAAAAVADHVVVMIHWGIERAPCPGDDVRHLADRLIAAGADVIAGHHPHVLQGIQDRGSSLVAFSLANFVWYHNRPPSDVTGVLTARLGRSGVLSHRFVPARVDGQGRPQPAGGADADRIRWEVASLAPGAGRC